MRTLIISLIILSISSGIHAQGNGYNKFKKDKIAAGINIGSKAIIGVDVLFKHTNMVNLRIGYNLMDFKIANFVKEFSSYDQSLLFDSGIQLNSVEFLGEYHIAQSRFRAVAGLAIFDKSSISLKAQLADVVPLNDLLLTPEEIGYGKGTLTWTKSAFYLGFAYGDAIPRDKWSIGFDFGVYARKQPQFDLEVTNLLRSNERSEDLIEEKLKFLKWWPMISFRLARKIK